MKILLYWPILFIFAFAIMLVIVGKRLYDLEKEDSVRMQSLEFDKYMRSTENPVPEEEVMRAMSKEDFYYQGIED